MAIVGSLNTLFLLRFEIRVKKKKNTARDGWSLAHQVKSLVLITIADMEASRWHIWHLTNENGDMYTVCTDALVFSRICPSNNDRTTCPPCLDPGHTNRTGELFDFQMLEKKKKKGAGFREEYYLWRFTSQIKSYPKNTIFGKCNRPRWHCCKILFSEDIVVLRKCLNIFKFGIAFGNTWKSVVKFY